MPEKSVGNLLNYTMHWGKGGGVGGGARGESNTAIHNHKELLSSFIRNRTVSLCSYAKSLLCNYTCKWNKKHKSVISYISL